jgi:hypothetical protein
MVKYKAWIHNDMIGEWSDPDSARRCILEYIEQNPEEASHLNFGAFKRTSKGLKVLYALQGIEQIKEHFDSNYDD